MISEQIARRPVPLRIKASKIIPANAQPVPGSLMRRRLKMPKAHLVEPYLHASSQLLAMESGPFKTPKVLADA